MKTSNLASTAKELTVRVGYDAIPTTNKKENVYLLLLSQKHSWDSSSISIFDLQVSYTRSPFSQTQLLHLQVCFPETLFYLLLQGVLRKISLISLLVLYVSTLAFQNFSRVQLLLWDHNMLVPSRVDFTYHNQLNCIPNVVCFCFFFS